jgi:hydroxymethylpyrimidine pyrophosphatase-like HAD family hydrolase
MLPRLIALDLDGTLLNSSGQVSSRNRAALELAQNFGAEIVISTGRRHSFAMQVLRDLGLKPSSAVISSNGTVIRTLNSDLIHRSHLPLATALWLCAYLNDYRNSLVLTFDLTGPDGNDSRGALIVQNIDQIHSSIGRWMRANQQYILQANPIEEALQPGKELPIQMMLCGPIERMQRAEKRLVQHPRVIPVGEQELPPNASHADRSQADAALHRTTYPETDLTLLDILPAGCSKASALRHLATLRGIGCAEILAIGDNWNDLAMLRLAGEPALMSNAPDDLRSLATANGWAILPSNDQDGVATAIEAAFARSPAWK